LTTRKGISNTVIGRRNMKSFHMEMSHHWSINYKPQQMFKNDSYCLSVFLWDRVFKRKKIAFLVDKLAVVTVLISKSSKSPRVMQGHQQHSYWQTKYEKLSYGNVSSLIYKL
jgi:hypothetical protein